MTKKDRTLLFSITAKDCSWDYFTGTGAGGQKRNKTAMCVRCTHLASGAVGVCKQHRQQHKNKQAAFKAMASSKEFQKWHKMECARRMGDVLSMKEQLEQDLRAENLTIEIKENGRWKKI
jgi:protein subunit release factor A